MQYLLNEEKKRKRLQKLWASYRAGKDNIPTKGLKELAVELNTFLNKFEYLAMPEARLVYNEYSVDRYRIEDWLNERADSAARRKPKKKRIK